MKNTSAYVPKIIEHLNPVTEQFGPASENTGQMQIPSSVVDIPGYLYTLLAKAEQAICDKATD